MDEMNEIDDKKTQMLAVTKIYEILSPLSPEQIKNVLIIMRQLFQPTVTSEKQSVTEEQENQPKYLPFHELFDAASPRTGPERALVAAYWLQVIQENEEWDSFLINKELKNFGTPSTNITRDLDVLVRRIPRWVHQTRKEGTSQQARKTYTLTTEGKRAVERMLANNRTSVESE